MIKSLQEAETEAKEKQKKKKSKKKSKKKETTTKKGKQNKKEKNSSSDIEEDSEEYEEEEEEIEEIEEEEEGKKKKEEEDPIREALSLLERVHRQGPAMVTLFDRKSIHSAITRNFPHLCRMVTKAQTKTQLLLLNTTLTKPLYFTKGKKLLSDTPPAKREFLKEYGEAMEVTQTFSLFYSIY